MSGIGASGLATVSRRVLVVEDETLVAIGIRENLEELGHTVVGEAQNTKVALEIYGKESPDLVLLDIRLGALDGIQLATELLQIRRVPMIIISAFGDTALINRATAAGVFGYLIKPISSRGLQAQIQIAVQRFRELEQAREENVALTQTLEERKLVERAKGILMKRFSLGEADAHKRLQLESQRRRIAIAELARKIIDSEELLGGLQ